MNSSGKIVDGFYVSENRMKLWEIELEMLDILELACKELNINYFMAMGSALGAVRHKGFIPWDDDIDVGMLRKDFDIFAQNASKFFPEGIDIQYGISDRGADCLMRIRNSQSTGIVRGEELFAGNKGAFIEVYCYDYCADNMLRKLQLKIAKSLQGLMFSRKYIDPHVTKRKRRIKNLFRWIPLSVLWNLYNKIIQIQTKENEYVDLIGLPDYSRSKKELAHVEDLNKSIYMPFENRMVRVAVGYDRVLRHLYGDYMKLPPLEKRGTFHSYAVFYDPNKSYKEYESNDIINRYFNGESGLELL